LESAKIEVASRTDAGVSARANALGISSALPPTGLLRGLNGIAPEIFFSAIAPITEGARVRHPIDRTYRYYQATRQTPITSWEKAAQLFEGEIDVRSFGRAIPSDAPRWRTIDAVRISGVGDGIAVEIRAPSFVWGMVRKIVAALREVDAGRLSIPQLATAIRGRTRLMLPLAEPEPLVLWEVRYPFPWAHEWTGPSRQQTRYFERERLRLWSRTRVLEMVPTTVTPSRRES
jgi:tRNA pseudouridine38-40 synthase